MYCGRKCSGLANIGHLLGTYSGKSSAEHMKKMAERAAETNREYSRGDLPYYEYWRRAKYRGKECDLTIDYIKDLWKKQNGKCAITRIPLIHPTKATNKCLMASLDRIESDKGYIIGNVQFVTCAINYAKNSHSDSDIRDFIKLVFEHYAVDKETQID